MHTLCEYMTISGESYFMFGARRVCVFLLALIYTQMDYKFLRMLH